MKSTLSLMVSSLYLAQAATYPTHQVHSISAATLHKGGAEAQELLKQALFTEGMIAVTDIEQYGESRSTMFRHLNECSKVPDGFETFPRFPMHDDGNTMRYSTAATITEGKLDRMDEPYACPDFMKSADTFRHNVDSISRSFIKEVSNLADTPLTESNFDQLIHSSNHLEHFHFFHANEKSESNKNALEMHTDHGFFIAFTPASYWDTTDEVKERDDIDDSEGFLLNHPEKGLVSPQFPNKDSIVFMIGDAMTSYDNRFKALEHTVASIKSDATRAWYGRMYIAPDTYSLLPKSNGDHTSKLGCTDGRRALDLLGGCDEGYEYCWHRCLETPDCIGEEESTCINKREGVEWDVDEHCACGLQCRNATDTAGASSNQLTIVAAFAGIAALFHM